MIGISSPSKMLFLPHSCSMSRHLDAKMTDVWILTAWLALVALLKSTISAVNV